MNLDDTIEEGEFRLKARAWIAGHAPRQLEQTLRALGVGKSVIDDAFIAEAKKWQKAKAVEGWACIGWPAAYGGRDARPIEQVIWLQEEGAFAALSIPFFMGHAICAPTLMAYATEDQKRRYLPPMAAGDEVWCQLFSEPCAGSDLAGIRTHAQRSGDEWIVNGQKIWTSFAHFADYAILLTRTNPDVPKHKGLTMFFLDMRTPGVEVRPIRQANGECEFNEVFLTDVRIPDSQRLGGIGAGWTVSLTTLMNERLAVGTGTPTGFDDVFELCRQLQIDGRPAIQDSRVCERLATWAARNSGLKYTGLRAISALSRGAVPGPENSIGKLVAASMLQEIAMFALDLQAEAGVLCAPDETPFSGRFQAMLLRAPGKRIEGGTDEIMRNIIAERVLGLPADIRVDKDVSFREIPLKGR